jgi:predicted transcriptional regulator
MVHAFVCTPLSAEPTMPTQRKFPTNRRSPKPRSTVLDLNDAEATKLSPWTFLSNHTHVLIVLYSKPDLVLRKVAQQVGITERAVQRIIQELEEEGFLTRERIGRRNRYHINGGMRLRHSIESHCTIDQILMLVTGNRVTHRKPRAR